MLFKFEYAFHERQVILSDECYWKYHELSGKHAACVTRVVKSHDDELFNAISWCIIHNIEPFIHQNNVKVYKLQDIYESHVDTTGRFDLRSYKLDKIAQHAEMHGSISSSEIETILKININWEPLEFIEFTREVCYISLEKTPLQTVKLSDLKAVCGGDLYGRDYRIWNNTLDLIKWCKHANINAIQYGQNMSQQFDGDDNEFYTSYCESIEIDVDSLIKEIKGCVVMSSLIDNVDTILVTNDFEDKFTNLLKLCPNATIKIEDPDFQP